MLFPRSYCAMACAPLTSELSFFNQSELTVANALGKLSGSPAFQAAIDGHTNAEELLRMFNDVLKESNRLGTAVPHFEV